MKWLYLITMSDNVQVLLESPEELTRTEIAAIVMEQRGLYVLRYLTRIVEA